MRYWTCFFCFCYWGSLLGQVSKIGVIDLPKLKTQSTTYQTYQATLEHLENFARDSIMQPVVRISEKRCHELYDELIKYRGDHSIRQEMELQYIMTNVQANLYQLASNIEMVLNRYQNQLETTWQQDLSTCTKRLAEEKGYSQIISSSGILYTKTKIDTSLQQEITSCMDQRIHLELSQQMAWQKRLRVLVPPFPVVLPNFWEDYTAAQYALRKLERKLSIYKK